MRVLLQRVSDAAVAVDDQVVGRIGAGLLLFLGVRGGDTVAEMVFLADKCLNLRIFEDADGKFNRSVLDTGGELLLVSQFTLYADARRGRRPSFTDAAGPEHAIPLYEAFVAALKSSGLKVATGVFGAKMQVQLTNSGPVTILLEKEAPTGVPL